jgi:hypothetical protein
MMTRQALVPAAAVGVRHMTPLVVMNSDAWRHAVLTRHDTARRSVVRRRIRASAREIYIDAGDYS